MELKMLLQMFPLMLQRLMNRHLKVLKTTKGLKKTLKIKSLNTKQ